MAKYWKLLVKQIHQISIGKTFTDCSTADVETAVLVGQECKRASTLMSTPVFQRHCGAIEGTLTFMAGGSSEYFP